jgi:hypothetical protein
MLKADGGTAMIENRTFDAIAVGDGASISRTVAKQDIELFAVVSGNMSPAHLDPTYAEAKIIAQTVKVSRPRVELPAVRLSRHEHFLSLLARAAGQPPVPTAVVHPGDAVPLAATAQAASASLIAPILVRPPALIHAAAIAAKVDVTPFRTADAHSAGERAVVMVHASEA